VESTPGEGTRFRVYLPVAGSQAAAASTPPQESAAPPLSGLVLVVDDEASVRAVMRRFLERWGYEVLEAADGIEALEIAERNRHLLSLVLLDLTMPKKDGIETFRELRQANRDVPVVLMSGFSEQAATAELGIHGLSGFIQKPFKGEHLRRVVADAMSG
jgi:CheY-like chemotaxis protein